MIRHIAILVGLWLLVGCDKPPPQRHEEPTAQTCRWEAIQHKQDDYSRLRHDWDAVKSGNWGPGAIPMNELTVGLVDNIDPAAVSLLHGVPAKLENSASNAYTLTFKTPDEAIAKFRPLACHENVRWVAMVLGHRR